MKRLWRMGAALLLLLILIVMAVQAASCPDGCICLVPEDAKNKGYSYCGGKEVPCGTDNLGRMLYCFSTGIMTPSVTSVLPSPQVTVTTICGQGCDCMAESDAKAKFGGLYQRCSDAVCGYVQSSATASVATPKYCFRKLEQATTVPATPSTVCPAGCACLNEADAKLKFNGIYERCSNNPCVTDQTATAVSTRYCFRAAQTSTTSVGTVPAVQQVCPDGCGCMSDEDGQKMGYSYCNGVPKICGYQSWTGSTAETSGQRPLYCYGKGMLSTCGGECECMSEATAIQKFGTYQFCSNAVCGYEQSASSGTISTTANVPVATAVIPKFCIRRAEVPVQVTGCSYSKEKQACTGTCTGNTGCVAVGTEKNAVTGEETPICKCQPGSCYFDYSIDTCVGSCPITGQLCQINTMSKDPLTGKTLYAECHCKAGEVAPVVTSQTIVSDINAVVKAATTSTKPCSCDPAANTCTGTCEGNAICLQTGTSTDVSGKTLCSECQCVNVCRYDPATNRCTGSCPDGGACQVATAKDPVTGAEKTICSCENIVSGTTPVLTPVAASTSAPTDPFSAIGKIFRSFFGWK